MGREQNPDGMTVKCSCHWALAASDATDLGKQNPSALRALAGPGMGLRMVLDLRAAHIQQDTLKRAERGPGLPREERLHRCRSAGSAGPRPGQEEGGVRFLDSSVLA